MKDKRTTSPVQQTREKRRKDKQVALEKLEELILNKVELKRPVFLVPGWTDESCKCWKEHNRSNKSIKYWLDNICKNTSEVKYINFEQESPNCNNFLELGEALKNKIWSDIGKDKDFDIIGHSMGGLDIRAAIIHNEPLLRIHNCITVATPHQGDHLGGVDVWIRRNPMGRFFIGRWLKSKPAYHIEQGKALDPDYEQIKFINTNNNKNLFLERVNKFYEFKGGIDFIVKGSAYINEDGIKQNLINEKLEAYRIDTTEHIGRLGITQDIRTIIAIVSILLDIKLEKPKNNYGIFPGGIQI